MLLNGDKVEINGGTWSGKTGRIIKCNYEADLYTVAILDLKVMPQIPFEYLRRIRK
jgi:ribosomal protein L24